MTLRLSFVLKHSILIACPRAIALFRGALIVLVLGFGLPLVAESAQAASISKVTPRALDAVRCTDANGEIPKKGPKACARLSIDVKRGKGKGAATTSHTFTVDEKLVYRLKTVLGSKTKGSLKKISRFLVKHLKKGPKAVRYAATAGLMDIGKSLKWKCLTLAKGVVVPENRKSDLKRLACATYAQTQRGIHVTSGTRSARDQAVALDKKIRAGDKRLRVYRNRKAANELVRAWKKATKAGKGRKGSRDALHRALKAQIERGVYISSHLKAGAVDVRSVGMGKSQKRALRTAAKAVPGARLIYEKKPPHFHIELNGP